MRSWKTISIVGLLSLATVDLFSQGAPFELRLIQADGPKLTYKSEQFHVSPESLITKSGIAWASVESGQNESYRLRLHLDGRSTGVLAAAREQNPNARVAALFQGRALAPPTTIPDGNQILVDGEFKKSTARTYAARLVPSIDGKIQGLLAVNQYREVFFVQLQNAPTLPRANTVFYLNNDLSEKYQPLASFDATSDHVDLDFDATNFARGTKPGLLFIEASVGAVPSRLQGNEAPTNDLRFLIEEMEISDAVSKSKAWITKYAKAESLLKGLEELVYSQPRAGRREAIIQAAGAIGNAVEGLKQNAPAGAHVAALREVEKLAYNPKSDPFDGRDIAVRAHALLDILGLSTSFRFSFQLPRIDYTNAFHRHTDLNGFFREVNAVVGAYQSNPGLVRLQLHSAEKVSTRTITLADMRGSWKEQDFSKAKGIDAEARALILSSSTAAALKANSGAAKQLTHQGISAEPITDTERRAHLLAKGVLIKSVTENEAAATAGLRAGDIVLAMSKSAAAGDMDRFPSNAVELGDALATKQQLQQQTAVLKILRDGNTESVSLIIPQAAGWTVPKTLENLAVIVTAEKSKYLMGEPIKFTVRLFNKSEEDFELSGAQLNRNIGVAFQRRSTELFPLTDIIGKTDSLKMPAGQQLRYNYVCFARVVPGSTRVSIQVPFANFYDETKLDRDAVNSRALNMTIDRKPWVRGKSDWRTLQYAALVFALGSSDDEVVSAAKNRLAGLGAEAGRAITKLKSDRSLGKLASQALELLGSGN